MFLGVGFGFRGLGGLGFWALFHPCSKLGLSGAKTGRRGLSPTLDEDLPHHFMFAGRTTVDKSEKAH